MAEPNETDSFFKNFTQQLLQLSQGLLVTEKRQIQAEIKKISDKLPEWEKSLAQRKLMLESNEKFENTLKHRQNSNSGISQDKRFDENHDTATGEDGRPVLLKNLTIPAFILAFHREILQGADISKIQKAYEVYRGRIAKAQEKLTSLETRLEQINREIIPEKANFASRIPTPYQLIVEEGESLTPPPSESSGGCRTLTF